MVVTSNHYRWDFIGLSTDSKPTPETSQKVCNGSTFYEADTSAFYIYYNDQWYLKQLAGTGTYYIPLTLAYIAYGRGDSAQLFIDLMREQGNAPVGGASYAFANTSDLTSLDLRGIDFSNVTDTVCMFDNASDLTSITWDDEVDMGNVETMEGMYRGTSSLTSVDLSKFATGEYLESVFNMFASSGVQSVDLGAPFDTSAVTDFYGMFNSCTALTDLYHLNNLRMESAANVGAMFYNCSAMTELNLGEGNRGESKNLLDVPSSYTVNTTYTSIPLSLEANTTYTIQVDNITTDGGGETYIALKSSSATNKDLRLSNTTKSVTVTPTADIIAIWIYADYDYTSSAGKTTTFTNLMVSEGSTATDYEPYEAYQLLTKQGLSTDPSDSAFWSAITSNRVTITPQGNGWLHVKQDVSGFGNFNTSPTSIHNFSGNTTYTIIVELKNVTNASGTIGLIQTEHTDESFGSFTVIQGASATTARNAAINLANPDPITVLVATTKTNISNRGLRFFNRDNVGVGTEYDIRCTVIEGDHSADWQNYSWEPYAFTPPSLSLSTANADYMLAGMTSLQSLDLSGWKSGSDDLASSHFWSGSRNLLNTSSYADEYINNSGGTNLGGGTNALFDYVSVSPSTTYTLSQNLGANMNLWFAYFDDSQTFISRENKSNTTSYTITTPSDCAYVRVWLNYSSGWTQAVVDNAEIQLEAGSEVTTYMPYGYSTNLTTLTLNGNKRLVDGKVSDSIMATFSSKQGDTITNLTINDPVYYTTDGTTPSLTSLADIWGGNALTTLEMTGWDLTNVDPAGNPASTSFNSLANLTTLTIGDFTLPTNGVNLAMIIGVENTGNAYTSGAPLLANLHLTGDSVMNVYNSGTGSNKSQNVFVGNPIGNGTGHIYVPANLVNSYKSDSFWGNYSAIIVAED